MKYAFHRTHFYFLRHGETDHNVVKDGFEKALQYNATILLVAHRGTYWALTHLFQLQGNRKIGNCVLTYISPAESEIWRAEPILTE